MNSSDGDVTLTAELAYNTYTVHFNGNGGTCGDGQMTDQTFTYDVAQNLTANAFDRTGYTFAGWAKSENGNVVYSDKQSVSNLTTTDGGTVVLYAKWTPITYTITYNLNGGSVATSNPTSYNIETPTFTLNNPTKEDCRFTGWTGSNGKTPQTTVKIYKGNDCNALIETATNKLIQGCKNTVIPDGVTTIGKYAFDGCTGLTSIEIPASVTSIGEYAFQSCYSLSSVEISASVTSIGEYAFSSCIDLTSVTIYAPSLTTYGSNAFSRNATSGRKIYVFSKSLETYKAQASQMGIDENDIEAIKNISLKDAADNRSLIAAAEGYSGNVSLDVTLKGRTLYKDGAWNTLCLPFNVTIAGSVLEGADVRALDNANLKDGVLTLNFTPAASAEGAVTAIEAGKPYIIKWSKPGSYVAYNGQNAATCSDIVSPTFKGVTITAPTPQPVTFTGGSFKGTYQSITFTDEDQSILFLGAGNTLYYPESGATIGAQRAYFDLGTTQARLFVLNFDGEAQGITTTDYTDLTDSAGAWYTLDGVRLDGKPTKKGLYIHGGRKVVIP